MTRLMASRMVLVNIAGTSYVPMEGSEPAIVLGRDLYEDMGEPSEITVTIEPGDLLNVTAPGTETEEHE